MFSDRADISRIFQLPWQRIVTSTEAIAASHELLANKIETDVERPLREYSTKNREMQSMTTIQGNLGVIARDLEKAQERSDKLKTKGGKANKVANVNSSVEDANQQWESQAPYVFEQLQSVDENRLNHLRDVLTQFQTHEVDQVEKNRVVAENTLNALLNVEIADEIKTFAARISGGRGSIPRRMSQPRRRSVGASSSANPAASLPPPVPTRSNEDGMSERSGSAGGPPRLVPGTKVKSTDPELC
jgi:F-BAR domain only protein